MASMGDVGGGWVCVSVVICLEGGGVSVGDMWLIVCTVVCVDVGV